MWVAISLKIDCLDLSKQASQKLGLFSSILGHVGDGNFHQAVMYDPNSVGQTEAVRECVAKMVHRAVEMEGTVSVCLLMWSCSGSYLLTCF